DVAVARSGEAALDLVDRTLRTAPERHAPAAGRLDADREPMLAGGRRGAEMEQKADADPVVARRDRRHEDAVPAHAERVQLPVDGGDRAGEEAVHHDDFYT